MADIKTILRELSVILGYILSKYRLTFKDELIDVKTYLSFIRKYCKNVNECNSEIQKIEELDDFVIHNGIIKNGLKLGQLLFEKLNLDGDIYWLGAKVKSKYPFDIKIGGVGISLKEDSYILKNPSFADYLNALVQPTQPFSKVHVFRKFAPNEFKIWYDYTYKKIFAEIKKHQFGQIIYNNTKHKTFIRTGKASLIFGDNENSIEIGIDENLDENKLNSRLGGDIFEHTITKWIKERLEKKDLEYEKLKKDCSIKAGTNLEDFVTKNLNLNSHKILELLQIYDESYYYGKSFGEAQLYQVPSNKECKVKLINIEIKVPKSQLNVYFTFEISKASNSNSVIFRVECRYSHGQFKGIPEAKLYYTDNLNHLKNIYKIVE